MKAMRARILFPALLALAAPAVILGVRLASPGPISPVQQAREAALTPSGFVYVPGGPAWLGSDDGDADGDQPRHRQYVPSFYIGRTEVSHAEWKRFKPEHLIPPGYEKYPVTEILRVDAEAYCRWAGGRLPTEQEWEKAARGTDGRRYPWGNAFDAKRCNLTRKLKIPPHSCIASVQKRGLKPVDASPEGASPYGALQMAGNAWEWVTGFVDGDPQKGIIRGGAVGYTERAARTYSRSIEGSGVT